MELLKGLNVVVTGAASGIGAETAIVAAEAGARVALLDLKPEAAEAIAAGLPGDPVVHGCDIADAAGTRAAFDALQETLGGIDAVVHAAGIWFPREDGRIAELDGAVWARTVEVNLTGTFHVCREAARLMQGGKGGSVVTLGSVVATTGWDKLNAYSASKGGVVSLSRSLAVELAPDKIRVNCICPGVIETPMTEKVLTYSKPTNLPLGRLGHPRDIAQAAVFLCSSWSSFMTGTVMTIDGGFSAA